MSVKRSIRSRSLGIELTAKMTALSKGNLFSAAIADDNVGAVDASGSS